jgi:hypothetical protein
MKAKLLLAVALVSLIFAGCATNTAATTPPEHLKCAEPSADTGIGDCGVRPIAAY